MVMSLSRVLWKVRSKAPTVTASVSKMVVATGEGYTTIRDSTHGFQRYGLAPQYLRIAGRWQDHELWQLLAPAEGQQ